jgi:hypothetical protein
VVVREDEAVFADDEAGAGGPRRLFARRRPASASPLAGLSAALIVLVSAAARTEEPMEQIVRVAAAAEEIGQVLRFRLHLGTDVDDDRRGHLGHVAKCLRVERAGDRRAVHRRHRNGLRGRARRQVETRGDHHAHEQRSRHEQQGVEQRGLAG